MRAFPIKVASIIGKSAILMLVFFLASAAVMAQAQATTADLAGTVVDPNGAVVPGATVTAKNIATSRAL